MIVPAVSSRSLAALNTQHIRPPAGWRGPRQPARRRLRGLRGGLGDCQSYDSWTSQLGGQVQDCSQYVAGTGPEVACYNNNNAISIAIQQMQEEYNDCIPTGASVAVNTSSGQWSVSAAPQCSSTDPTCTNMGGAVGLPTVGVTATGGLTTAVQQAVAPVQTPAKVTPTVVAQSNAPVSTTVGSGVAQSNAPSTAGGASTTVAPATTSFVSNLTSSSADWISGVPNWALLGGGLVLAFLLFGGRR